jgi:hypothetical protein
MVAHGAEYYLQRNYEELLGRMPEQPWSKKCDIFIFPNQETYLKRSRQAPWSPAMAGSTAIGGRLTEHHIMTYQSVEDLLSSHLSHEIMHVIHSAMVDYHGGIPIWFREGLAVKMEPWYKHLRMARVMRDGRASKTLFTLEELTAQQGYPAEDRVDLFYAQSYALTNAIYRSGSPEQFVRFCHEILDKDVLEACQSVYDLGPDELQKRWETHEADLVSLLNNP